MDNDDIRQDGYVFIDDVTGVSVEIENYYVLLAKCGQRYKRLELDMGEVDGAPVTLVFIPRDCRWDPDQVPATKREQQSLRRIIVSMYKDAVINPVFVDVP